jgi:predicted CXXCH cytochrome family protein
MGQEITVPVVVYTGIDEPTSYLAGGNFWWVKEGLGGDDTKGHNIFSGEPDDNLISAPMNAVGCEGGGLCHQNLHEEVFFGVTRQGCTKCHMVTSGSGAYGHTTGYHHADDSETVVGTLTGDTDGFFRYLVGHMAGEGHGVCGIEDPDWEATPSESVHNEYLGFSGTKTSPGNLSALGHTMTGFCCGCHGYKHEAQAVPDGNWIRHPSGAILCPDGIDGCELASYSTYNPQNPVSRPDLSGGLSDIVAPDTDMVMCLSCHRAHGSPYPKKLRWHTLSGCDDCHTTATQCAE